MKKLEKETRQKAHGTGRKVNEPVDLSILTKSGVGAMKGTAATQSSLNIEH
jgi:hypothetical protein